MGIRTENRKAEISVGCRKDHVVVLYFPDFIFDIIGAAKVGEIRQLLVENTENNKSALVPLLRYP